MAEWDTSEAHHATSTTAMIRPSSMTWERTAPMSNQISTRKTPRPSSPCSARSRVNSVWVGRFGS